MEAQQTQLAQVLDSYERQVDDLLGSAGPTNDLHAGADAERERAYALAESVNGQLDEMGRSLSALIGEVNSLSRAAGIASATASEPTDDTLAAQQSQVDPVAQIAAILNAHLASLNWIEGASDRLRGQVEMMEGRIREASGGQWRGLRRSRDEQEARGNRVAWRPGVTALR